MSKPAKRPAALPEPLPELRRVLAETLVRSRLDLTDEILTLSAFLTDFRWREGVRGGKIRAAWRALRREAPAGHEWQMELTFPYCHKKCSYCFFGTKVPSAARLAEYAADAVEEIDFLAPVFEGARFRTLLVGRGSPAMLDYPQLEALLGRIFGRFRFEAGGMRSIESNPATLDERKIRLFSDFGFTRISFGVESLDPKVLRSVNRGYQTEGMVRDTMRWCRAAGFRDISVDLVFGMVGDTVETFLETFKRVAELRPSTVNICCLSLTDAYMKRTGMTREKYLRYYDSILPKALKGLRRLAAEADYTTDELTPDRGIWMLVDKETPKRVQERWSRCDSVPGTPLSTLGIGQHGRSHVFGRMFYGRGFDRFAPRAPAYRVSELTPREEMAYYVLHSLNRCSRVSFREFRSRFGAEFRSVFAGELKALKLFGKIRTDRKGVELLPTHTPERVFYSAVFLLDTLANSPFSGGGLASVMERLKRLGP